MIAHKLKSRRGTSIIIALLVLLICVTAGAAALTAASANAGRYTHLRRDQQRYLAVASAAKLVRGELAGQSFSATAKLDETVNAETLLHEYKRIDPGEAGYVAPTYSGAFADWLLDDLNACFEAQEIPVGWGGGAGTFTGVAYDGLGMDTDSDEPLLDQVKWSLTLADDYTITARFWLEDEGKTYYPTVLTFPAQRQEDTQTERVGAGQHWVTTKQVTVTWSADDVTVTQS